MEVVTPWGSVGYLTYKRTYARRLKENNENSPTEELNDSVERVIQACSTQLKCGFTPEEENQLRYYLLTLKASVAGRFWWQLGTKTVEKLGLFSLQNCAFTVVNHPVEPFCWTFDALMLGSGVGYNIQKEFVYEIPKPKRVKISRLDTNDADFIVPDSREGWVELLRRVLDAHYYTGKGFSYSTICIRGKGSLIKGFGGVASGAEELCWGMAEISKILNARAGKKVRPIDCLDIMNIIGSVVVSGNVRRSAQIAIGDCDDVQFLQAKRWDLGNTPNWRAMSNNSVICNDFSLLPEEFWEGYKGNGEPYGLINLKLAQSCGRLGETQYPDPECQGFNPCVGPKTEILTKVGYERIGSLVGQSVEVWNGFEWSEVIPKITGHNRKMVTVTLSDGRFLRCTENHKWVVVSGYNTQQTQERIEAKDLKPGQKLLKHEFPILREGVHYPNAYTQGFVSAEGMDGYDHFWLYEPKYQCEGRLNGTQGGKIYQNYNGVGRKYLKLGFEPKPKSFVPFDGDLSSRLEWFAGLLDGDGTELREGGTQIASVDHAFLLNVQKMLSTMGVQSKVTLGNKAGLKLLPDGKGGEAEYPCQDCYRLLVGAVQMQELKTRGLRCERMGFNKAPNRDASQFVKVVSVEDSGEEETVYCFTEPKRNLGCFEGIVTGQCAEQSLADKETCCLAEEFLPNIESEEEHWEVTKLLYRINKHSLALKCHQEKTQAIVHKNMRMGIGVTGVCQATPEQLSWLGKAYLRLRAYDLEYSAKNGFNPSIKLTTVKPSGTLSLLAGVTPGCHPGYAQYFLRRIRIASNSPLVDVCRNHGYSIEFQKNFDGTDDNNTVVVAFPCSYPEGTQLASNTTAVGQLELVRWLQTNWSDNSVSCTIYYKKEELASIRSWLAENYNTSVKTCSFLLHQEHGFVQAPYEEISKERYLELAAKSRPITSAEFRESEVTIGDDCATGACPIK